MNDLKIVFMGTPEFAVPCLKILVEHGFDVVGVITAPDKPKGRGQKLIPSAVKEYALSQNLKIMQPTNLKSEAFLEELKSTGVNLQVVVAFRMLPESVWSLPELGTFNLHASLLPQYRGAAPINWALINGETKTGVTTFFLKHEIDTGNLIFQEEIGIGENENVGDLYLKLMNLGAELVLKTVKSIQSGQVETIPQDETVEIKKAPKIFKQTCEINWDSTSSEVHNFVRGLSPYPAAWTKKGVKVFKILETRKQELSDNKKEAGTWFQEGKNRIFVATSDGAIELLKLQPQGKRPMTTAEFLAGNTIN